MLFALLLAVGLAIPPAQGMVPKPPPAIAPAPAPAVAPQDGSALDEAATRFLVTRYKETPNWTIRAIALVALGRRWDRAGAEVVVDAFDHKDARLHAFALEALRRTDAAWIRGVATKEIVDRLVRAVGNKNPLFRERAIEVLRRIEPSVTKDDSYSWQTWWQKSKANYTPAPLPEVESRAAKPASEDSKTSAERFLTRAFDLNESGLEVVFCVDATGSMQPTIDAARGSLRDLVRILGSISPKLKIAAVYYQDVSDFPDGARVLSRLDEPLERTEKRLASLTAAGGGDIPESVERGLALALDPAKIGWTPDANKVVVIIGDAPPHAGDIETCKKLAREAFQKPLGKEPSVYTGGKANKSANRPFVTSCILVGEAKDAAKAFQEIAAAGGGSFGKLDFTDASGASGAPSVVANILALSFGTRFEAQARAFAEIYQEYSKADFFR